MICLPAAWAQSVTVTVSRLCMVVSFVTAERTAVWVISSTVSCLCIWHGGACFDMTRRTQLHVWADTGLLWQ